MTRRRVVDTGRCSYCYAVVLTDVSVGPGLKGRLSASHMPPVCERWARAAAKLDPRGEVLRAPLGQIARRSHRA